ncbi:hypothetical protein [Pasteurella atlantica]|uniref:hypothetical protein n=1 Tax=Pasteurellaceae TaxID=712 RepID=UPI00276B2294|nr:hypothetical protein [Pasteurella atlantica]MDP8099884.1 hypothetical protein [Pasteurella atlantica]MDP8107730.1 hypothetical protein [Pasteurella atlantica]MDP8117501.1 hypothetical protein [Pasteurella atlantica]
MNLEKNIQEFKCFLAGKYDYYLVTRGDEYAGWNYFTETYFDSLEYKEKEEVFFQLLLSVYDFHLESALGYIGWLNSPTTNYLNVFLRFYKENNCNYERQRKIFNWLFVRLNNKNIWDHFDDVSKEKKILLKEIADKFNIEIQRDELKNPQ